MATYSFISIGASIQGPGGNFSLGFGSGNAENGAITIAMEGDKNTMTTGADGSIMHSLHASQGGTFTFRLLKTSPVNGQLSAMLEFQRQTPGNWGQNVIQISDVNRGDVAIGQQMAFSKFPDIAYSRDGGDVEWQFRGFIVPILGFGVANINSASGF